MGRLGVIVALAASAPASLPAMAQAAERYDGRTSQGETVVVQTGEGGMVTQLRLRWTPGCHSDTELTSRLRMYPAFFNRVNTARRIGGTERYRARAGAGTYARIRATVRGRRVGARWKGSFSATAKIRRDGRTIDRCRTPRIRWSAKRVEGS